MAAPSTLPDSFYGDFGISQEDFKEAFDDLGDGTFRLKPGWSLAFTHAVWTTDDRPTTVASPVKVGKPVHAGSAGDLWQKCTGHSIREEKCCVYNCPKEICRTSPQDAGATAHVYGTFQSPDHDIQFMILIPTCSADNNARQCAKSETNFPPTDQQASVLYTREQTRMIFITTTEETTTKKGGKGKGTGKGGGYKGDYPPGAPPGANIVG